MGGGGKVGGGGGGAVADEKVEGPHVRHRVLESVPRSSARASAVGGSRQLVWPVLEPGSGKVACAGGHAPHVAVPQLVDEDKRVANLEYEGGIDGICAQRFAVVPMTISLDGGGGSGGEGGGNGGS